MIKTSVYLPDDLKEGIARIARDRGLSEAEVIRDSLRMTLASARPTPMGGLYASGKKLADRADELLAGFGER
jgi:metal-responsive CopG/Arc/MetJ family transcriptional regulator